MSELTLVQADLPIGNGTPEEFTGWRLAAVNILGHHLQTAGMAWHAYRQPTPQDWFKLLGEDLGALPQLGRGVQELLEELPMDLTGLGATQMRMLELISAGNAGPFDVFPGDKKGQPAARVRLLGSPEFLSGRAGALPGTCGVRTR